MPEEVICSACGKKRKNLRHLDPETKKPICKYCYRNVRRREKSLLTSSEPIKLGRKSLYPTKESVIEALATRIKEGKQNYAAVLNIENATLYRRARKFGVTLPRSKFFRVSRVKKPARSHEAPVVAPSLVVERKVVRKENPKKSGRKPKYPTREAVIATLETREAQGKENFPSVIQREDTALYNTTLKYGVELPTKENPPIIYYPGDLVKNQNPRDPGIYGQIGKVLGSSKKGIKVDFGERGGVIRVYLKGWNLNNIVLHAHKEMMLTEVVQGEMAPA